MIRMHAKKRERTSEVRKGKVLSKRSPEHMSLRSFNAKQQDTDGYVIRRRQKCYMKGNITGHE